MSDYRDKVKIWHDNHAIRQDKKWMKGEGERRRWTGGGEWRR